MYQGCKNEHGGSKGMRESTRRVIKMHGVRLDRALHHYIYFKFYDVYIKYFYLAAKLALPWISSLKVTSLALQGVFERFHARVLAPQEFNRILSLHEDVSLDTRTAKQVVPFTYAYDVILENPEFIAAIDCPCRKTFGKDTDDMTVCICVGTGALFWLEQGQRQHSKRIDQSEALDIIRRQRAKGCITTAWFKVATGGRSGVICSCHPDYCVGLQGMRMAKNLAYAEGVTNHAPSGYTIAIDSARCINCGMCVDACHFNALTATSVPPAYQREACLGCGLCAEACPERAITMLNDPKRPPALDRELDRACRIT